RIDAHLERLQPVAIDHSLERESVAVGRDKTVEMRERGRLSLTEIGEKDPALFNDRIRFLPYVGAQVTVIGLGRRLQAFAMDVEQPPVKRATQAAVFQSSVREIGAAMRTAATDQPIPSLLVPKNNHVFAKKRNAF